MLTHSEPDDQTEAWIMLTCIFLIALVVAGFVVGLQRLVPTKFLAARFAAGIITVKGRTLSPSGELSIECST